jgi:hypothetical protein
MIYRIGFTGTRLGMIDEQKETVYNLLQQRKKKSTVCLEGLHGDCIGADANFHQICRDLDITIYKVPSNWERTTAHTDAPLLEGFEPMPPYARNRILVKASTELIGCPFNYKYTNRSGTWYTMTYAASNGKKVIAVFPDGSTQLLGTKRSG